MQKFNELTSSPILMHPPKKCRVLSACPYSARKNLSKINWPIWAPMERCVLWFMRGLT